MNAFISRLQTVFLAVFVKDVNMPGLRKDCCQEKAVPRYMRGSCTIPGVWLILLALLGFTSQVQAQEDVYELSQPVGEVGGLPDPDPFYFYPTPGTFFTEMVWADNKQLEAGPGILGFYVHGFTAGTQSFTGYLLDAGLNPIDGTEFSGATNVNAVQIDLAETTRFSGLYITLGTDAEQSLQGYMFNWIASLTVVEGDAVGNQPPIADAGRPISWTAGLAGLYFNGTRSEDPDGRIVRYDWDPGDGTAILEDAGATPEYTYAAAGTYNVTLTVTDDRGAVSSDSNTATIARDNEPPFADAGGDEFTIGLGTYAGTVGVPVQFDGSRSRDDVGIVLYSWEFGDVQGSDATGVAPEFTFDVAGDYTVQLTVTDTDGESALDWATASISGGNQPPTADAGPPVAGTSGVPVQFNGTASGDPDGTIVRYDWQWGDGTSDEDVGPTPQHTYAVPRDYTVTLIVVGDDGVSDSDTTTASIDSAPIPPRADAGGPYQGTTDAPIEFNGTASDDFDGLIVQYDWEFGDGNTGTGPTPTPSNTYTAAGNYTVTLTVTDDDALTSTDTQQVTIADGNEPPRADANGPYDGVAGVAVEFDGSDSSDPDGSIALYEWSFGDDGTATGANPSHTYAAPGNYTVTLTVTDSNGVTDGTVTGAAIAATNQPPVADADGPYTGTAGVAVNFDGSASSDADGAVVAWDWDFGDNRTGSGETTSHIYTAAGTYTVKLTVTDDDGDTSAAAFSTTAIDSPNVPPVADAGGPYVGKLGVPIDFSGTASDDPDGTIVEYDWEFGDGNTGTGPTPTPSNTYTAAGNYTVTLTVTDDDGASASTTTRAIIGDAVNLPPTADPGGPYTGDEGVAVNFDGRASSDPDGTIASYDWEFGDTNTATGARPSHTYAAPGPYAVTLTVTDAEGKTDTQITTASIGLGNQPPTADAGGPYAGIVGQPILFSGGGSSDSDGSIEQSAWTFGDSGTSNQLNPTYTYTTPGPYTVTLTVTDDESGTDSDTALVIIGDGLQIPPTAEAGGPYGGRAGAPVTFNGTASSDPDGTVDVYEWLFGDNNTGTGQMPDNTYLAGGRYHVTLQITDDDGLPASDSTTALIGQFSLSPTADANGPYRARVGAAVAFDGRTSRDLDGNIVQYDWNFGDGPSSTGTGVTPSYTYAADGKYLVTLTVTDDSGQTDTDITVVTVGIGNLPPEADAGDSRVGVVGVPVDFSGGGIDPDGSIVQFEWDYGDGSVSGPLVPAASRITASSAYQAAASSQNGSGHTYDAPGVYLVRLTVTDSDGVTASDVTVAEVTSSDGNSGDNIFGCSIGNGEVNDPVLPLLLLLAVLYRACRRAAYKRM